MAPGRRHRGPHGLGGARARRRSPTRRSPASRRSSGSTPRRPRSIALRGVRQLAPPHRRARCRRRPRCRRAASATWPRADPDEFLDAHGDARARDRCRRPRRRRSCASASSRTSSREPVLKGFIIGLALTIIIGQVPELLGIESGTGDFFEKLVGLHRRAGPDAAADAPRGSDVACDRARARRRSRRSCPGSLIAVARAASVGRPLFDLDSTASRSSGPSTAGFPSLGLPDVSAIDYFERLPAGGGRPAGRRSRKASGAAKTYASERPLRDRPQSRAARARRRQPRRRPLQRHGRQRQPLQDRRQRLGAARRSQLSGLVVAALTIVTLLFLTGLFEELPEATLAAVVIAARRRAGRHPRAASGSIACRTGRLARVSGLVARPDFIAAIAAMLGVLIFDTLPGLFIGIAMSMLLLLYRSSRPHVAVLGGSRVSTGSTSTSSGTRRTSRCPAWSSSGRRAASSSPTPTACGRPCARTAGEGVRAVVLDAESVPFVDVTAVRMLVELTDELERRGTRSCWRATSARCATCSAAPATSRSTTCFRRSRQPSRPRVARHRSTSPNRGEACSPCPARPSSYAHDG